MVVATELQRLVDGLGWRLRRNVAVDDPRIHLKAYSSHEGVPIDASREQSILNREVPAEVVDWLYANGVGTATGPFRLPLAPELGIEIPRLGVPIRQHDILLGFLWILEEPEPIADQEIGIAIEAAETLAVVLQRDRLMEELTRSQTRELVRDLVALDDAGTREHAATQLVEDELFVGGEPIVSLVVTLHPPGRTLLEEERVAVAEWLQRTTGRLSDRRHVSLARPDHGLVLLSTKDPMVRADGVFDVGAELVDGLAKQLPETDPFAGVGEPVDDLTAAHQSYQQARRAAHVARIVGGVGRVAPFARLGVYGLLTRIPAQELTSEALPPGLVRLLAARTRGDSLVSTLEVYLDHAGDAQAAAKELVIHRATLYYRLNRIKELTGMDLARGDDRLALHLGLKVARLAGLLPD
jgi:hypothetical protein